MSLWALLSLLCGSHVTTLRLVAEEHEVKEIFWRDKVLLSVASKVASVEVGSLATPTATSRVRLFPLISCSTTQLVILSTLLGV